MLERVREVGTGLTVFTGDCQTMLFLALLDENRKF
jgi:hypothetical protein